jgi:SRSO17 transposase
VVKTDYYLSNATAETELAEFARVAKAEHRIEECIERGKSEAGLADYEVRNWKGWHHHQILSLIASWFLVSETRRGKKMDTGDHGSADPRGNRVHPASRVRMRYQLPNSTRPPKASRTQPTRDLLSLETV